MPKKKPGVYPFGAEAELNRVLEKDQWHWSPQEPGSISLPDFIRMRANGEAKMANGTVFLKKPGPDLELVKLFEARIQAAQAAMNEHG
jgi:hypothetical protein